MAAVTTGQLWAEGSGGSLLTRVCRESSLALCRSESIFSMSKGSRNCRERHSDSAHPSHYLVHGPAGLQAQPLPGEQRWRDTCNRQPLPRVPASAPSPCPAPAGDKATLVQAPGPSFSFPTEPQQELQHYEMQSGLREQWGAPEPPRSFLPQQIGVWKPARPVGSGSGLLFGCHEGHWGAGKEAENRSPTGQETSQPSHQLRLHRLISSKASAMPVIAASLALAFQPGYQSL